VPYYVTPQELWSRFCSPTRWSFISREIYYQLPTTYVQPGEQREHDLINNPHCKIYTQREVTFCRLCCEMRAEQETC